MLPMHHRYLELWSETFAASLPSEQPGLDEPAARRAVEAAMAQAWETVTKFAAHSLLNESRLLAVEADRQVRDKARGEHQRAEIVRDSAKIWKSHYGKTIASQLEGHTFEIFAVVRVLDLELAVPDDRVEEFTRAVRKNGRVILVEDSGQRAPAFRLYTIQDHLDAADYQVALELVDTEGKRLLEERDRRARETGAKMAAARKAGEERQRYGAAVPRGDDG